MDIYRVEGSERGRSIYQIYPNHKNKKNKKKVLIVIQSFHAFDLIDLSQFPSISSLEDLSFYTSPLTLTLAADQFLTLPGWENLQQLTAENFQFSDASQQQSGEKSTDIVRASEIGMISVIALILLTCFVIISQELGRPDKEKKQRKLRNPRDQSSWSHVDFDNDHDEWDKAEDLEQGHTDPQLEAAEFSSQSPPRDPALPPSSAITVPVIAPAASTPAGRPFLKDDSDSSSSAAQDEVSSASDESSNSGRSSSFSSVDDEEENDSFHEFDVDIDVLPNEEDNDLDLDDNDDGQLERLFASSESSSN